MRWSGSRRLAGLRLSGALPDETTILHFRHLLERRGPGETLLEEIDAHPDALGQGDDRGRGPHRRAVVDEEPHRRAGPGDAPDEEGQSVAFRDEGAYRRGCAVGVDAQPGDDDGEHIGRGDGTRAGARERGAGVGRRRLSGGGQARREPGHGRGPAGGDEGRQAPGAGQGGRGGGGGEAQGLGAGQGGASAPVREAPLRLRQDALSGAGEEHPAHRRAARARQSAHRRALRRRPMRGLPVRNRRKAGETVGSGIRISISRYKNTTPLWSPALRTRAR